MGQLRPVTQTHWEVGDARDAKRDAAYKQRGEALVLFLTQREVEQNDRDEDHEAEEEMRLPIQGGLIDEDTDHKCP